MLDVGQHVLGHEITFGDVGVARQDEGLDADLLIRLQLGHDLIGVTDDRRTGTGTGPANTGPEIGLGVPVVVSTIAEFVLP